MTFLVIGIELAAMAQMVQYQATLGEEKFPMIFLKKPILDAIIDDLI